MSLITVESIIFVQPKKICYTFNYVAFCFLPFSNLEPFMIIRYLIFFKKIRFYYILLNWHLKILYLR